MTDAELEEENKRLEEEGIRKKKQEHVQGTFLQKYYHKGIFYLDDESIQSPDDIRNRDFHAPTERDMVNKLAMPKVMQHIAKLLPFTYFSDTARNTCLKPLEMHHLFDDMAFLLVFLAVEAAVLALVRYITGKYGTVGADESGNSGYSSVKSESTGRGSGSGESGVTA